MPRKRKQHTAAFKAQVALAAHKGDRTVNELAGHYGVHPTLIHAWKKQLLAGAETVFANGVRVEGVADGEAQKAELFEQIGRHGKAYFEFVTTPGVEPTNNLAEQAIRFVVIDRRVTQGTRGEKGRRWCERIWTIIATCSQQGRSVFEYLSAAVAAYFGGGAAPSLLPTES